MFDSHVTSRFFRDFNKYKNEKKYSSLCFSEAKKAHAESLQKITEMKVQHYNVVPREDYMELKHSVEQMKDYISSTEGVHQKTEAERK